MPISGSCCNSPTRPFWVTFELRCDAWEGRGVRVCVLLV